MHKDLNRIVSHGDNVILFIHGIVGTPNHFQNFVSLVPDDWSICNMLLDGHGKGVKDFSNTSMENWKAQVEKKVQELSATHNQIFIVAHSMGTLFAIQQAIKNPRKIKAIFLLATPLKIFIKPRIVINSFKVLFCKIKPDDYVAVAAKNTYGIEKDKRLWLYLGWIPRFLELLSEIRKTRKIITDLSVPCFAYQSKKDELVALSSCKILKKNTNLHINILEKSSHFYYEESDYGFLLGEFEKMMRS